MTVDEIRQEVRSIIAPIVGDDWKEDPLVVLTGGEPFRQNIMPLVHQLLAARWLVQVETNGTIFSYQSLYPTVMIPGEFSIVCSPKTPDDLIADGIRKSKSISLPNT